MTKYARILDGVVLEVFTPPEGSALADCFHKDLAGQFHEVAETVVSGSVLGDGGQWIAPVITEPEVIVTYPVVTPDTFRMLFTPAEEIEVKKAIANAPDSELAIWWSRLFDGKAQMEVDLNLKSVQGALALLVTLGILTPERPAEMLTGKPQ
jgi:hypothetical protein